MSEYAKLLLLIGCSVAVHGLIRHFLDAKPLPRVTQDILRRSDGENWIIVDARPKASFILGHVPGAKSLPFSVAVKMWRNSEELLPTVSRRSPVVVYCDGANCSASEQVGHLLNTQGYSNIHVLEGGYSSWLSGDTSRR